MLATSLIWLSVAVAALALLDLFLSKAQKTRLSNVVIKIWNGLDEAKGWSFANWAQKPAAKWWLAVSLGFICAALTRYDGLFRNFNWRYTYCRIMQDLSFFNGPFKKCAKSFQSFF